MAHDAPSDAVHDAPRETGGGPTWSALYAGYFGPGTVGHCGNVGCHAATQAGFKCGASATTCYNGLVNKGLINPQNPSQSIFANPQLTPLSWFGGAGPMPKDQAGPNAAAAQAVTAWVAAGVPNN